MGMKPIRAGTAAILAVAALAAAACGSSAEDLAPAACLGTSDQYLRALESAPGPVRLEADTKISDCLVPNQDAGQLANIGQTMVVTATKLNTETKSDPGGDAAVQLGYLLGAASGGADAIHTDLVRRLNSAARFTAGGTATTAAFERAFGRGYAAGRASG